MLGCDHLFCVKYLEGLLPRFRLPAVEPGVCIRKKKKSEAGGIRWPCLQAVSDECCLAVMKTHCREQPSGREEEAPAESL